MASSPGGGRVGIVADDLTGAADIGGMFARAGHAVRIAAATRLEGLPERWRGQRTDVLVIDTDSRSDAPDEAAGKVRRATRALRAWGAGRYYKKTCSVLRGNVGAEMDAMLETLGVSFGVLVAAFPGNGRSTRGGIHYVHGVPLAESEFARDPVYPKRESDLLVDLGRQCRGRVGLLPLETVRRGEGAIRAFNERAREAGFRYLVGDAQTRDDMSALAAALAEAPVLLGASGLAAEVVRAWPAPPPWAPWKGMPLLREGPVLVVVGSTMPRSRAQVEHAAARGVPVHALPTNEALREPRAGAEALAGQVLGSLRAPCGVAIIRSENTPEAVERSRAQAASLGMSPLEASRRIATALAEAARRVHGEAPLRGLVVFGGDTAAAACRALGVEESRVLGEVEEGLPCTLCMAPSPLLLVLKPGSFGSDAFVAAAERRITAGGF